VRYDTNGEPDVFVRDLRRGVTRRVSVSSSGRQANGPSGDDGRTPHISADGRYVAFYSDATNLVRHDTNGEPDAFVRDLRRGVTRRVSVSSSGRQANGPSGPGGISADGRYVGFTSGASNLVPHDTNGQLDVFVRDLRRGVTQRVSVDSSGKQLKWGAYGGGSISADGQRILFDYLDGNVYVRDIREGVTLLVSVGFDGKPGHPSYDEVISADGQNVAFSSGAQNLVPTVNSDGTSDQVFVRGGSWLAPFGPP